MKIIQRLLHSSFFSGFSRAFDLGATSSDFKYSRNDNEALKSDWEQVGKDLREAMGYYDEQSKY